MEHSVILIFDIITIQISNNMGTNKIPMLCKNTTSLHFIQNYKSHQIHGSNFAFIIGNRNNFDELSDDRIWYTFDIESFQPLLKFINWLDFRGDFFSFDQITNDLFHFVNLSLTSKANWK